VLRARLLDEQPDLVPELHRRAARWFADHDDPVEAIGHANAGGDLDLAAELIELSAPGLHRVRREALVRGWLEALPPELFESRPVLSIALVGARMSTGDPTGVDTLLTGVESWLEPSDDGGGRGEPIVVDHEMYARLPAQVAVYRAALFLLSGEPAGTIEHAERAVALAEPDDHLRLGSATALMGLAHWSRGDLEPARRRYDEAIDHLLRADHLADALGCILALADMRLAGGDLDGAHDAFARGLELVAAHPGLRGAADMHVGLAELHLDRDDLATAREQLDVSRALGEHAGLPQHPYRWRVATARLRLAEGDTTAALDLLDEADRLYNTDFSPSVRPVAALTARVRITQGDLDAARRWADRRGLDVGDELTYVTEFEHLTLARTLVALQVRERVDLGAVGLLDRLVDDAEHGGRTGAVVEALALRSLAEDAGGDRASAVASVDRALGLADAAGYVRVFVDLGPAMLGLLRSVTVEGRAELHRRRVVAAFGGADAAPSQPSLVDPLSDRELEVLRLLRSELSGPDIARELVVSLNTVRTHTKNIYAKLGATSRREAVRRADELGL
jgi:LuxR family maltose regulon positive regulatory protein